MRAHFDFYNSTEDASGIVSNTRKYAMLLWYPYPSSAMANDLYLVQGRGANTINY